MQRSSSSIITTNPVLNRRSMLRSASLVGCLLVACKPSLAGMIIDAAKQNVVAKAPQRIVSIGGAATEILIALGAGDRIVAIDSTAKGVPGAEQKPDVGYMRALAAEGILAQSPDLIIATLDSGPKEVIDVLRQSGVPLAQLTVEPSVAAILQKTDMLGELLELQEQANSLQQVIESNAAALEARVAKQVIRPKALFILGLANNRITVGGANTSADAVLQLAGAENIAATVDGFKPFSPELVVSNPPDVIVMMANSGHDASIGKVMENEALAATPAAKAKAIIPVDGSALLAFGPRTLVTAADLADKLHSDKG
jgi:iron complex transport system substrate-binding protein